jgi:hypothetical protein
MEVTQEFGIDLLAIQEVRWLGKSILENNCTVYMNGYNRVWR